MAISRLAMAREAIDGMAEIYRTRKLQQKCIFTHYDFYLAAYLAPRFAMRRPLPMTISIRLYAGFFGLK